MLGAAARQGLAPVQPVDLAAGDSVIRWMGRSYTFLAFALRKA
jgi:hypothetical protein